MTLWNPVTAPASPPPVIGATGAIASSVTPDDFAAMFGPSSPVGVPTQLQLDRATQRCEEYCKRPLRNAVWTHRCRIYYDGYVDAVFGAAGAVFPPAIPIQNVVTPAGTVLRDNIEIRYVPPDDTMLGFWGYTWIEQYGTVTYQGGWDHETLPSELRDTICKVAYRLLQRLNPGSPMDPPTPGIQSPHVSDVGFMTTDAWGSLLDDSDQDTLDRYKYKQA